MDSPEIKKEKANLLTWNEIFLINSQFCLQPQICVNGELYPLFEIIKQEIFFQQKFQTY